MHETYGLNLDRVKHDLEPEEMLRVIFNYAAKIANERLLDRVLMLMAGREMIVCDAAPFGCSMPRRTSCGAASRTA